VITLYDLKPRFQALLRPLTAGLARAGITANQVTVAAAVGSVVVGVVIAMLAPARWPFLLLPLWLFLRMALNAIDGMLAREFGQKTALGAYLNEICDVVSDAALYLPLALLPPFTPAMAALVVFLAALSEFAGVLGVMVGASRRYDGPMGKSDRALVFGALGLWIGVGGTLPGWLAWSLPLVALLIVLNIVNRVRRGLAESRS
jgi:CDP-diacylglycerol--glycerol-3-phosphate 3-phosphatidyltransferase